jgi:hypothetical protein
LVLAVATSRIAKVRLVIGATKGVYHRRSRVSKTGRRFANTCLV